MEIIRRGTNEKLSESVEFQSTVYVAGKLPTDLTNDITVQAKSVLQVVEDALIRAGTDKGHILLAQIYLKHRADAAAFNAVWNEWLLEGCAPARICVEANMLNDAVLVELNVTAAK